MSFSIRAARQGVHIQQNPNTVPTASGDKSLDCLPCIDVHLGGLTREGCTGAIGGPEGEVADGQTDACAVRGIY